MTYFTDSAMNAHLKAIEGGWVNTNSGRRFHPLSATPENVFVPDIAHSLSMLCRYNGHVDEFYSVAEHSVLLMRYLERMLVDHPDRYIVRNVLRWALFHDASEAYLGDVVRPLKRLPQYEFYRSAEARLMEVIAQAVGLVGPEPTIVKTYDLRICGTEARQLFTNLHATWTFPAASLSGVRCEGWSPRVAKQAFLDEAHRLVPMMAGGV